MTDRKKIIEKKPRYEGLDQLRGLLAFTVMIYHYVKWQEVNLPWFLQNPLDILGLYTVSTFYALSGCALYIVYHKQSVNKSFLWRFWVKRCFRIIPLFWFITTLVIPIIILKGEDLSAWTLFLNYSLLFSWIDPNAYMATGSWSIGNEWAFYSLFPVLIWALRSKTKMLVILLITCALGGWYCFVSINADNSVAQQWAVYISPMNQFPLFLGGFMIGKIVMSPKWSSKINIWILLIATILFVALSYRITREDSIYGWFRLCFVMISISWCYCFGVLVIPRGQISRFLNWLGMISYTLYLLHPVVMTVVRRCCSEYGKINPRFGLEHNISKWGGLVIAIVITLIGAHLVFKYLEKPAIRLGQKITRRKEAIEIAN